GLQGAASTAYRVRSRSPPVLPRADPRRGDVQSFLLVPRRPADVRRLVRIRALGDAARPRHAADPAVLLAGSTPLRPRQTRAVRAGGGVVVSIKRIFRDYKQAGSVKGLIGVWGLVADSA